jgi:hypothetical protein
LAFVDKHTLEDTVRATYLGNAIIISRLLLLPIVLVVGVIIILIVLIVQSYCESEAPGYMSDFNVTRMQESDISSNSSLPVIVMPFSKVSSDFLNRRSIESNFTGIFWSIDF